MGYRQFRVRVSRRSPQGHLSTRVASDKGPTEDDIKGAFATLLGAWDQVAESVSHALHDPETREHLKKAASSFATALGTTITDLGDEFKKTAAPGDASDDGDG